MREGKKECVTESIEGRISRKGMLTMTTDVLMKKEKSWKMEVMNSMNLESFILFIPSHYYLLLDDITWLVLFLVPIFASLAAQSVKNQPALQETQVWSLGWEDLLEEEMATHSSILAWKISWTKEPGGLQSTAAQRVGRYWATNTYLRPTIFDN